MIQPDLRILALVDAKLLPPNVQESFDHWRVWASRDAVAATIRKRLHNIPGGELPILNTYLERLEQADTEQTIFEGIYAVAGVVDVYRQQLGLHSEYLVVIMSSHLNPWGLVEFQQDFALPAPSIIDAAQELWRLARESHVDVEALLAKVSNDETLIALEHFNATQDADPKE